MAQFHPNDLASLLEPGYTLPSVTPDNNNDTPAPAGHVKNQLEWHQMAAIASMLQHYFQPDDCHPSGMLIADDVGVEKTLENYGLIASVVDILDRAIAGRAAPPIISESMTSLHQKDRCNIPVGDRSFLGGHDITNAQNHVLLKEPHLLIVPNSLLKQAKLQAQAWLPKGAFDVLTCAGSVAAQTEFWSKNGPLHNSQFFKDGNKHRIIIFTTHSVCFLFGGITLKLIVI